MPGSMPTCLQVWALLKRGGRGGPCNLVVLHVRFFSPCRGGPVSQRVMRLSLRGIAERTRRAEHGQGVQSRPWRVHTQHEAERRNLVGTDAAMYRDVHATKSKASKGGRYQGLN